MELSSASALEKTINQIPRHSFPRLLDFYHHSGDCFSTGEPVELPVNEILTSRRRIDQIELAQIFWPVSGVVSLQARNSVSLENDQ